MRWARMFRGGALLLSAVVGVAGVALIGFTGFLWTSAGNRWLGDQIEQKVSAGMEHGHLEIGAVRTDLFSGLDVDSLRIVHEDGTVLLDIPEAHARYDLLSVLTGRLKIHRLTGAGIAIVVESDENGVSKFVSAFGKSDNPSTEPFSFPIEVDLDQLSVDGVSLRVGEGFQLKNGAVSGKITARGPVFEATGTSICALLVNPGPLDLCALGPLRWDGDKVSTTGLVLEGPNTMISLTGELGDALKIDALIGDADLAGLDPILGKAGLAGTWGGKLSLGGSLSSITVNGNLAGTHTNTGSLTILDGHFRPSGRAWGGTIHANDFDVEQVYPGAGRPIVLNGVLALDATGINLKKDLDLGLKYSGSADIEGRYHMEDAALEGRLNGGVLTLTKGDFSGIAGHLGALGTIDVVNGPMSLVVKGKLEAQQLAALGIQGLGSDGLADLVLTGDLKKQPGRFDVQGDVTYAPFVYDQVRFKRLVADVRGVAQGADFRFGVVARATDGVAYGLGISALHTDTVDVRRSAGTLTAVGHAHTDVLSHPSLGYFETSETDFDVTLPSEGARSVDATVELGAFDLQTFPGSGGKANVRMAGDDVRFQVDLDAWGRAFLRTAGTYDLQRGAADIGSLVLAPTPRLAWTSSGGLQLRVVEGGIADAHIDLRSLHGDVRIDGAVGTVGELDGEVHLKNFQLDALAELAPDRFSGLSGVIDLDLGLLGPAADPFLDGTTKITGLWIEDTTRWLDLEGSFRGRDGAVYTELTIGSAGESLGLLTGELPVVLDLQAPGLNPDGEVTGSLQLFPGSLDRLEYVTATQLGLPEGDISATLSMSGLLRDPAFGLAGVVETPVGDWEQRGRVEFQVDRNGRELTGWAGVREGLSERLRVSLDGSTRMHQFFAGMFGTTEKADTSDLSMWIDDMVLAVVLDGLPAASVAQAAQSDLHVGGDLVGAVIARGNPYTPVLEGRVHLNEGSLGHVPIERGVFALENSEGVLSLHTSVVFEEGSLKVDGPIPVAINLHKQATSWTEGELALKVTSSGVPLGLLSVVDTGITGADGLIAVNGEINGTFAAPEVDLDAAISEGSFTYTPLGLRFTDVEGELEAGQRRIKLTTFRADTEPLSPVGLLDETRKSVVRITGAANLENRGISELSARVGLKNAWVLGTYKQAMRLDGDLLVSGSWPALQVDGDLDLVNGRIVYDSDSASSLGSLQIDPAVFIHREGIAHAEARVQQPPVWQSFDLDIGLDLNRNLEVIAEYPFIDALGAVTAKLTRANVAARLGGDLDIALGEGGSPILGGEIEVVDGTVKIIGTQFRLKNGRLVFLGGDLGGTQLELNGASSVQGTPIDLAVRGTINKPSIKTTSPGYDQSQVLLMLITGRSVDDQEEDGAAALGLAAASLLAQTVLSGSSTGALTIEPNGAVRVGAPWSSTVFTQLVMNLFAGSDENRVAFALDWSLAPRMLLELGAGDRFQWTDLSWEIRF